MTLVVAQIVENDLFVVGDSRLVDMDGTVRSPINGTLKIQLLSPELCIAFAGEISLPVMKELQVLTQQCSGYSQQRVAKEFLALHKRTNNVLDFIIASLSPYPGIYKISEGNCTSDIQAAWIGDIKAFSEYQKQYHQPDHIDGHGYNSDRYKLWIFKVPDHEGVNDEIFSKMCNAMRGVIYDSGITTVGDYLVAVTTTQAGFNYINYLDIDAPLRQLSEGWNTVQFGTAAEGGHAIVALSPANPGIGAFGIHYLQGNFGAFFAPEISFAPLVFSGVNRNQFIEKIKVSYGIELYGPELH